MEIQSRTERKKLIFHGFTVPDLVTEKLIGYQGTLSSVLFLFTEHPPAHSLIASVIPLPRDVS